MLSQEKLQCFWVDFNNALVLVILHVANVFYITNLIRYHSNIIHKNASAARQKGLSSCVHQKHTFRDNRICSV